MVVMLCLFPSLFFILILPVNFYLLLLLLLFSPSFFSPPILQCRRIILEYEGAQYKVEVEIKSEFILTNYIMKITNANTTPTTGHYVTLFVALYRSLFVHLFYLGRNTSSHELMFLFYNSTVNKDYCILYLVSCKSSRPGQVQKEILQHYNTI